MAGQNYGARSDSGSNQEKSPSQVIAANQQAMDFLSSINFKMLGKAVFSDYLVTVSEAGKEIGELTISVEEVVRDGEICYLVHAHSRGIVDGVPCGTSFTTYVGRGLTTLEQTQHEYMKIPGNPLDKKTVLVKQGNQYYVKTTITEGDHFQELEKCISANDMQGFISEGSNVLLQRIFTATSLLPEDALFVALDPQLNLCLSNYKSLSSQQQYIGSNTIDVTGIQRSLVSDNGPISEWITYFLSDGHMSSRATVGSPVTMKLVEMPKKELEKDYATPLGSCGNTKRGCALGRDGGQA